MAKRPKSTSSPATRRRKSATSPRKPAAAANSKAATASKTKAPKPASRAKPKATTSKRSQTAKRQSPEVSSPPKIVAVGASAGGLEPIEQFFDATGAATGVAYVIVQHLSPDFKSMMPELLGRHSKLNIVPAVNGIEIEANTIYLNPPRASLEIKHGRLMVNSEGEPREFNLPINTLFESLAKDRGAEAVCIVMSGTGSDGTAGSKAVAAGGGVVMAQDPATAKFESMPRSVIENVPGSIYAPPHRLAELVQRAVDGEKIEVDEQTPDLDLDAPEREILRLLQIQYGLDFGYYKTSTVGRRIQRRAQLAKHTSLSDYLVALSKNPEELEALYTDLLIGVTAFFRDRKAFELLGTQCIPDLVSKMVKGQELRVWVPGCASGEEPYTIAIMIAERARILDCAFNLKLFATDLHPRSLKLASRGIYSGNALAGMPEELRDRYFEPNGDNFQVVKAIRERVIFSKHNLIKDPPFTRMDLVSCRNLLIYLDDEAQRKALAMFHFALNKSGVLFLGPSEALNDLAKEFDTVDQRWRIYRKRRDVRLLEATRLLPLTTSRPNLLDKPPPGGAVQPTKSSVYGHSMQRQALFRAYDAVLQKIAGTSVLLSGEGEVLHVFGDIGKFLQFRAGLFSTKISDLVGGDLVGTISAGLDRVKKLPDEEFVRGVTVAGQDGALPELVIIRMSRLEVISEEIDAPILLSIRAEPEDELERSSEVPSASSADDARIMQKRIDQLERDLRYSEQTLHTTIEELETANEELQATNEELQATNEELMAANEELQTVNEELHAVNEELFTVSSEHQTKIDELTSTTNDLDNLLASTNIGVLFLDKELHIRRVTPAVTDTFNILPRDIGRPVSHVTARFEFPDFEDALARVLATGAIVERSIHSEGQDFLLRVLPYRKGDSSDGVVVTFVNISEIARANRSLGQFADIVSHDLKAPMRAIRHAGEWIVEDLGDDVGADIREHAEMLTTHVDRLDKMLTDLRDFSNLKLPDDRVEAIDLLEMLNDIGGMFTKEQLVLQLPKKTIEIETARAPLRLVFQNLIENAVKHAEKSPVTVKITAEAELVSWKFSVSDNGPGIDPRHHEKIFLPFRKLKADDEGGSGIGLALVKKTVEERGGLLELVSDPEEKSGTTFHFTWQETA